MPEETPIIADEVLLQENRNLHILQKSLSGALKEVFGEYSENQRFLDLKRVPLICKDVANIAKNQEEEKRERERQILDTATILEKHRVELNTNLSRIELMITKKEDDHETRIRLVETFMNNLTGKMAMIGIATGLGSSILVGIALMVIQSFAK